MSERPSQLPVLVAMTGATGAIYGIRLLEVLRELEVETHLVVSRWAEATIKAETDRRVDDVRALAGVVHDEYDLSAPPATSATARVVAPTPYGWR